MKTLKLHRAFIREGHRDRALIGKAMVCPPLKFNSNLKYEKTGALFNGYSTSGANLLAYITL